MNDKLMVVTALYAAAIKAGWVPRCNHRQAIKEIVILSDELIEEAGAGDSHCLCRADIAQHEAINDRLKADLAASVEQIERLRCGVDLYRDGCIRLRSEIAKLEDENMKVHHSMNAKHASLMAVVEWAKENVPGECSCSPEYTDRNLRDRSCQYCLLNAGELWALVMEVK